jgi:transcription factor IIIB subunit 2
MLIDFSDLLQVNVFELGHTYLQLVQTLNLRLPLVDPSHYISRFAALLEFGEETHKVATDAVRLVQRFDRDWMTRGRRPAGICGAALLLAARMNNFRRSVEEIVQVVKIADTTLKKRLDEFKATPSGGLTLSDFRNVWLEEEMDPPAFTKGKEREEAEREARERAERGELTDEEEAEAAKKKKKKKGKGKEKAKKSKKGKRKRGEEEDEEEEENGAQEQTSPVGRQPQPFDPTILNDGILAGALDMPPPQPLAAPDMDLSNIDPVLLGETISTALNAHAQQMQQQLQNGDLSMPPPPPPPSVPRVVPPASSLPAPSPTLAASVSPIPPPSSTSDSTTTLVDETVTQVLAEEVSNFLHMKEGVALSQALDEAEERRLAAIEAGDELADLDDEELDRFILSEEEVKIKERVWVELNRDYLEALAGTFCSSLGFNGPTKWTSAGVFFLVREGEDRGCCHPIHRIIDDAQFCLAD